LYLAILINDERESERGNRLGNNNNEGLQKIGRCAFYKCTSLGSISVPSTITDIRGCAFKGCESLQEVILHQGTRKIGEDVFEDCQSVEVFRFPLLSKCLVLIANNWADFNNKVNEVRGVIQWEDGELFVPPAAMENGNNWGSIMLDKPDYLLVF